MSRRAVITGMGILTAAGIGPEENWNALVSGKSGVEPVTSFDPSSLPTQIAAEIKDFDPVQHVEQRKQLRTMGKADTFGLAATRMAIADSGLAMSEQAPERGGVFLGCGDRIDLLHRISDPILRSVDPDGALDPRKFGTEAQRHMYPLLLLEALPNSCLFAISTTYNLQGDHYNTVTAGVAGAQAIGRAFRSIQYGSADYAIAGGFDSGVNWMTFSSLGTQGILSRNNAEPSTACRPFDRTRDGLVIGEGAGILILEELSHAQERGAKIHAELVGYAETCDAHSMFGPRPDGTALARAMTAALADAELEPSQIDYVNADGEGTPLGDRVETLAIKQAFGAHSFNTGISSTKPVTGHLLAASGAVELLASIMTLTHNTIPPTANYRESDPDCDLDYTPNQARELPVHAVLSISRGFGGRNAALVVKEFAG